MKRLFRVVLSALLLASTMYAIPLTVDLTPVSKFISGLKLPFGDRITKYVDSLKPQEVYAVTRELYWVGGSANWDGTAGTKWSLSDGGAGGEAIPDTDDNVHFTAASGVGTVSIASGAVCQDLDFTGYSGHVGSAGTIGIDVYGSLTQSATMVIDTGGGFQYGYDFLATSGTKTITMNGVDLHGGEIRFDGNGGTFNIQDDINVSNLGAGNHGAFRIYNGIVNTNNHAITTDYCQLGSTPFGISATLSLGSSVIIATINLTVYDPLTLNAGTSSITVATHDSASNQFLGAGKTFHDVTLWSVGTGVWANTLSGTNTFTDLTLANSGGSAGQGIPISADQVVTGTFTCTGYNAHTRRLLVYSNVRGTSRQITLSSNAVVTNTDFRDIAGLPSSKWDLSATNAGDKGGNYGITFVAPQNNYWVMGSGSWSDTTHWSLTSGGVGGTGRVPLPQDTAVFDTNSITIPSRTVTMDYTDVSAIDASTVQWTPTFSLSGISSIDLYGSLTLGVVTWNPAINIVGRRSIVNISSTSQLLGAITIDNYDQTVKFMNDLVIPNSITLTSGFLDLNDKNISCTTFDSSTTTYTRGLLTGTGTFTITSTAATTKWNVASTNLSIYNEGGMINLTNSGVNSQTFAGGGITTYPTVKFSGAGNYQMTVSGSNTFTTLWIDRSQAAKTVIFTSGTTQTVTNFSVPINGVVVVTIGSTAASASTLSKSSGSVVCDYLSISWSTAAGGASWYAGAHATNGGNNVGWIFGAATAPTGTTDSANTITQTTANIVGTITSLGSFSTVNVFFEYGETVAYGHVTTPETRTIAASVTQAATGLVAGTTYHFRMVIQYDTPTQTVNCGDRNFTTTSSIPYPPTPEPGQPDSINPSGEEQPVLPVGVIGQTMIDSDASMTGSTNPFYPIIHLIASQGFNNNDAIVWAISFTVIATIVAGLIALFTRRAVIAAVAFTAIIILGRIMVVLPLGYPVVCAILTIEIGVTEARSYCEVCHRDQ